MLGLLPLAGLLLLSGEFRANGTVIGEARVGQAPFISIRPADPIPSVTAGRLTFPVGDLTDRQTDLSPRDTAVGLISPIGDIQYEGPKLQLLLDYGPRLLWRRPNPFGDNRALVLHVANLAVTVDATRTVRLIERASFSYGQADYLALTRIVSTQAALPPVLDIMSLTAGTGLRWDAGSTWRYEAMFDVEHRRTLGTPPEDPLLSTMAAFRQTNFFLDTSGIARLSRRDDLILTVGVSDRFLSFQGIPRLELFAVTPQVGWRRRLTWSTVARLSVGASFVRDRGGQMPVVGAGGITRPVGSAEVSGILLNGRGVAWGGSANATLDYFVDPFLRTAGPRLLTALRTQVLFEPQWTVGLEGIFSTSLRGTPIPGNPNADETVIELALPVRHQLSSHLIVETGVRWSVRAPRIRADDVTFRQRQNWIYVSFTATTRQNARWMAAQPVDPAARDQGAFARVRTADESAAAAESGVPGQPGPPTPATPAASGTLTTPGGGNVTGPGNGGPAPAAIGGPPESLESQ